MIEVLSLWTAKFDRQEKYQAYERHGVREYWIVDPVHEGQFVPQGAHAGEATFHSQILGIGISVKAIFVG